MIALLAMVLGLVVGIYPLQSSASTPVPYAVAHRCGPSDFGPENLKSTCAKAARNVYAIEMDVRNSKSGTPWVMHDWNLARTTNCSGGVIEKTDAQLRTCRADGTGEPLATFYETLVAVNAANRNTRVFVHYNSGDFSTSNVKAINDAVNRAGFSKKAVYMSWLGSHTKAFRSVAPAVPRLRLLEAGQGWYSDPNATDIMPVTQDITPWRLGDAAKRGIKVHGSTGEYGRLVGTSVSSNMLDSPLSYFRWLGSH